MMLGFTPESRPPMITVPELLFVIALVAAIIALIAGGTHLWKHRSQRRES